MTGNETQDFVCVNGRRTLLVILITACNNRETVIPPLAAFGCVTTHYRLDQSAGNFELEAQANHDAALRSAPSNRYSRDEKN
nr:hypothetical protein [Mycolicibacterium komanii]